MNSVLDRLWVSRLPIRLRLLLLFVVAALIPVLTAFAVIQREVRAVDLENLRTYITERGNDRVDAIRSTVDRARAEMEVFVNESQSRQRLMYVASGNPLARPPADLISYIDNRLVGGGLFKQVRVLSADVNALGEQMDGGVVQFSNTIITEDGPAQAIERFTDQSDSVAYSAALTAATRGDLERLTVYTEDDMLVVEIIQVLYLGRYPAAYVVGRLNVDNTLLPILYSEGNLVANDSYLATITGEVIAQPGYMQRARQSAQIAPVNRALGQSTGTAIYEVGGVQVVGHYRAIPDLPLVLITETATDTTFSLTLAEVYNQAAVVVLAMLAIAGGLALFAAQTILSPIESLRQSLRALRDNDFESPVDTAERSDEFGRLGKTFMGARREVRSRMEDLRASIDSRMRDVQATQEISRFAVSQRDTQTLMHQVVDLIRDLFQSVYHAQIFLIDSDGKWAVLRASTGESGRQLLERGHRLAVGSVSVIGQVTDQGRVVVARDIAASEIHKRNEFLPLTRAELAIPLRIGDRIIGALDVQSQQPNSFTGDEIKILQIMADQIAVAIENSRLYQESVRQLEQLQATQQEATGAAWREYLKSRRQHSLLTEAGQAQVEAASPLRAEAMVRQTPVIGETTERGTVPFAVPIHLRGQVLGAVEWEVLAASFSSDNVELAQELVNRLAVSLDNARLFQESRRAIDRERMVNEIAAKLTTHTEIDTILQTAVREVGQALRVPQVSINLAWAQASAANAPTPDNGSGGNGSKSNGKTTA